MKIYIKPTEIIELSLWDDYYQYIHPKDVSVEEFLNNNEEFEIDSKDALVMGLLKTVKTNNLVHRMNQHIQHLMQVRSITHNTRFCLKKKVFVDYVNSYRKKFPKEWTPSLAYESSLVEVFDYIDELLVSIEKLKSDEVVDQFGTHQMIQCNHIKKILKQHN